MRWLWIGILAFLVAGSAYLWFFAEKKAPLQPKDVISQIEEKAHEGIDSRPVVLEAKPLEAVEQKLEATKTLLKEKTTARAEVQQNPHGTPEALMAAGAALGEIGELESQHPERKAEFLRYYKDCYENEETMTVTRVQCLKRYVKSAKLSGSETESVLGNLPRPVQSLYRKSEAGH